MIVLRELTAASFIMGPFVDSTDGVTAETALVLGQNVIRLGKNGAAFASKNASDTAVHKENGYYGFNLSVTDLNTPGSLLVVASTTGALPVWEKVMVMASPVYDSLFLGTDKLQVDVREIEGADPTDTIRDSIVTDATRFAGADIATIKGYLDTEIAAILAAVDTEVAAIKAKTDQLTFTVSNQVDATASTIATAAKAEINAEVVDVVRTDTNAELSALPGASPTMTQMLLFLYEIARNKITTTSTQQKLHKDDGTTVLGTWAVSDDGTTFTKGEIA